MKKKNLLFVALLIFGFNAFAQPNSIHWMTIEQAQKANLQQPKKIFVDVYTDWCGWCKRLDATTYRDETVIDYINQNFYAVKLNAETKDTVTFNGTKFGFLPDMKVNGAAVQIMGGQLVGYPTTSYVDENGKILSAVPGYLSSHDLLKILHYFGDDAYLKTTWNAYSSSFDASHAGSN
jgi:thioredoxin-related protein